MKVSFRTHKYLCLAVLAILLAADVSLAAYSIHMATMGKSPRQQLTEEHAEVKLFKADIKRAKDIQAEMPNTKADCDRFERSLLPVNGGYSAVSAELTDAARSTGVALDSVAFKPEEIKAREITEVQVEASVAGQYRNVVQFLNKLQRSQNYYAVEGLTLASGQAARGPVGSLRVSLRMKSYFTSRRDR